MDNDEIREKYEDEEVDVILDDRIYIALDEARADELQNIALDEARADERQKLIRDIIIFKKKSHVDYKDHDDSVYASAIDDVLNIVLHVDRNTIVKLSKKVD